jgi:asparagine synthase (glutamine-hydrolysing)
MRDLVRTNQDPNYNYVNLGWISALGEEAKEIGANAHLTGEHGNVSLNAGGLRVLGDMVKEGQWLSWAREASLAMRSPTVSWRGVLINSFQSFFPAGVISELVRRAGRRRTRSSSMFLNPEWISVAEGTEDSVAHLHTADFRQLRLDLLRMTDVGTGRKGYLAMFGGDQRAPLGDRRVVEFSLRLPNDQLFRDGRSRPLARRALADRVPAEVLGSPTRGYQAADWFEKFNLEEIGGLIEEIASSSSATDLIDVQKMREALAVWPVDEIDSEDAYQRFAVDLPLALGTGLFIIEAQRWLAGKFD